MKSTNIPWVWLKETPPGKRGLVPGLGIRFNHLAADWQHVERIFVEVAPGKTLRVMRKGEKWTRPDLCAGSDCL